MLKMPSHIREPWLKSFQKEFQGIIKRHTVRREEPNSDDIIGSVMEVYKAKLAKIDKLKYRVVYRGNLHSHDDVDTCNPYASWMSLMVYLAEVARLKASTGQTEFMQAYKDCVFVMFPQFWAIFLPPDLAEYCGVAY
jgi:hypothetical protein